MRPLYVPLMLHQLSEVSLAAVELLEHLVGAADLGPQTEQDRGRMVSLRELLNRSRVRLGAAPLLGCRDRPPRLLRRPVVGLCPLRPQLSHLRLAGGLDLAQAVISGPGAIRTGRQVGAHSGLGSRGNGVPLGRRGVDADRGACPMPGSLRELSLTLRSRWAEGAGSL